MRDTNISFDMLQKDVSTVDHYINPIKFFFFLIIIILVIYIDEYVLTVVFHMFMFCLSFYIKTACMPMRT